MKTGTVLLLAALVALVVWMAYSTQRNSTETQRTADDVIEKTGAAIDALNE